MDTILIIRDSVAMCVNKTAEICQPCVNNAGTTWQDVAIVLLICLTLLIIALCALCNYFKWKKYERVASAEAAKEKRNNDVEDRQWKLSVDKEAHVLKRKEDKEDHDNKLEEEQKAHELKRKEEREDHDKKRTVDLEDKLLCLLKDLAEIERDADGKEIKKYNDESKAYIAMLEKHINELSPNKLSTNDKEA